MLQAGGARFDVASWADGRQGLRGPTPSRRGPGGAAGHVDAVAGQLGGAGAHPGHEAASGAAADRTWARGRQRGAGSTAARTTTSARPLQQFRARGQGARACCRRARTQRDQADAYDDGTVLMKSCACHEVSVNGTRGRASPRPSSGCWPRCVASATARRCRPSSCLSWPGTTRSGWARNG